MCSLPDATVCMFNRACTAAPGRVNARRSDERGRVHTRRGVPIRGGYRLLTALPVGRQRFRVRVLQLPAGGAGVREHRRRDRARQQRPEGPGGRAQVDPAQHRRVRRQSRSRDRGRHVGGWSQRPLSRIVAHVRR